MTLYVLQIFTSWKPKQQYTRMFNSWKLTILFVAILAEMYTSSDNFVYDF